MGFNFRAKERIAYDFKWNKYLLTKSFPLPAENLSAEKKAMRLLELYLKKDLEEMPIFQNQMELRNKQ